MYSTKRTQFCITEKSYWNTVAACFFQYQFSTTVHITNMYCNAHINTVCRVELKQQHPREITFCDNQNQIFKGLSHKMMGIVIHQSIALFKGYARLGFLS